MKKNVIINIIYNVIYQILIFIIPLITMPYISRVLGADGIGIYSYTYSIAYYFMIIAMLGLNNYGNRTIAKVRDDKTSISKEFWSIYAFQLITTSIMIILYFCYIVIFCKEYKYIALLQSMYVISAMFDINWFFWGIEKFKLTITRNTLIKVLSLILIFIFVKTEKDIWKYTTILAGSTLISNIVLFSFLKKYVRFAKITKSDILKHLKPNLILFLPVIAVSIYKIMDKIMLGILSNITEVGYYENAEKIISVPIAIITAVGTVMLPGISNMISNDQEEQVKYFLGRTMPLVMCLSFAMMFGLIAISKNFAIIYFGKDFEKTGILIQLLAVTVLFFSWGNVIRTQYLIPKEMDRDYIISAFLGAIANFIMNIIFIPKYQSIGACLGTICAEFIVAFYQTFVVRKDLEISKYIKDVFPFLIKALIMYVILIYIEKNILLNEKIKIILQIFIGVLIYAILNIRYIIFVIVKRKENV